MGTNPLTLPCVVMGGRVGGNVHEGVFQTVTLNQIPWSF